MHTMGEHFSVTICGVKFIVWGMLYLRHFFATSCLVLKVCKVLIFRVL